MRRLLLLLWLSGPLYAQPEEVLEKLRGLRGAELRSALSQAERDSQNWPPGPQRACFFRLRGDSDPSRAIEFYRMAAHEPELSSDDRFEYRWLWAKSLLNKGELEEYRKVVGLLLAELPSPTAPSQVERLRQLTLAEAERRSDPLPSLVGLLSGEQDFEKSISLLRWWKQQNRLDAVSLCWARARELCDDSPWQKFNLWAWAPLAREAEAYQAWQEQLLTLAESEQARYRLMTARALNYRRPRETAKILGLLENRATFALEQQVEAEEILSFGPPQETIEHTRKAFDLALQAKVDPLTLSRLRFNLANNEESLGRRAEALEIFEQGLQFALLQQPDEIWRFFSRAHTCAIDLRRVEQQKDLERLILANFHRVPPDARANVLKDLLKRVDLSQNLGLVTEVRLAYQKQLVEARQSQNWNDAVWASRQLASLWRRLGDPRSARQTLEQMLKEPLGSELMNLVRGDLLVSLGEEGNEAALESCALALLNGPNRSDALQALADSALRRRDYAKVLEWANQLPGVTGLRLKARAYECLRQAGPLLKVLDEWDQLAGEDTWSLVQVALRRAEWDLPGSERHLARVRSLLTGKPPDSSLSIAFFNGLRRLRRPWRAEMEELAKRHTPEQCQDLFCYIAVALGPAQGGREWLNRVDQIPEVWQGRINQTFGIPKAEIATPKPALGAVLDEVRLARPELGNLLTLRSTNIEPLQKHLRPGECLVCYVATGVDLLVVWLTHDRADYLRVPCDPCMLSRQLLEDWQSLSRRKPVALESWSRRLLLPVLQEVKPTRLLIVPTGELWKLPFQALSEIPTSQLTSGDLLKLADGSWTDFRMVGSMVGIGAPPEAELPGATAELQEFSKRLPKAQVWSGQNARAENLLDLKRPIQLLHLATHTRYVSENPLQSEVQFHQGRLRLSQLHQLPLAPGSLAVLSSCRGGLGQEQGGSEPVSLATALSAAGADRVVAHLWDADDEASRIFFDSFYRNLSDGKSLALAFQVARNSTRKRFPQPYYWAGFCLIGNAR